MRFDPNELLWEQKYRPQVVDDCVLPTFLKQSFKEMVAKKELKNLLLVSPNPGTGKTTVARALCNELEADMLFINASEESGIDVFRTQIRQFASTVSLAGGMKVVVLDEADNLSEAAQKAFRGMIEEFSKNCRFILTCNYQNKIIEPIQSRLTIHTFTIPQEEKAALMKEQILRCLKVLELEGITVDNKQVVAELVKKKFPDNRALMVDLQNYSLKGVIDEGILGIVTGGSDVEQIVGWLKNKQFKEIRQVIPKYASDYPTFVRSLYDSLYRVVKPTHIPLMIEIIGDNQKYYKDVPDIEIHMTYLCVLLMTQLDWN